MSRSFLMKAPNMCKDKLNTVNHIGLVKGYIHFHVLTVLKP